MPMDKEIKYAEGLLFATETLLEKDTIIEASLTFLLKREIAAIKAEKKCR